jgi:hypothetical protein
MYVYIWKCQKETPRVTILNKNVIFVFFFYKIGEQEGATGPVGVGHGLYQWKGIGCRRANTMYTVCKWKIETF